MPDSHANTEVLTARLDGMVREMDRRFDDVQSGIARIEKDVEQGVKRIEGRMEGDYVTRKEFLPVMWVAYGMVGTVTLGVLAALLAIVMRTSR